MAELAFDRTVEVTGASESIWQLIADMPRLVSWIGVVHNAREIEPLGSPPPSFRTRSGCSNSTPTSAVGSPMCA